MQHGGGQQLRQGEHAQYQVKPHPMRDLFDDIFAHEPRDPVAAARRAVRPQLRRRFYEHAAVVAGEDGFAVTLDGRPVMTPARRKLAAPKRLLGQALAAEWEAQREVIDPAHMPLTRLANTIIDGVADSSAAVTAEVIKYLGSDLVCYRAESPAGLIERQAKAWNPVLSFASEALGAHFALAQGMTFVAQSEAALAAAGAAIPHDPWRLGALHAITTLTGSALIALAVLHGALPVEDAWAVAHVDEDWNMEFWGRDALALERRAFRYREMQAAGRVLQEA
jgi:chaperone required for assembly of F1-ATPase